MKRVEENRNRNERGGGAVRFKWILFCLGTVVISVPSISGGLADTQMFKQNQSAQVYASELQNTVNNSLWRYTGDLNYPKSSTCSIIRPDSELSLQFDSQHDGSVEGKSYGRIGPATVFFDAAKARQLFRKSAMVQAETACRANEDPGSDWSGDASLQITVISAPEAAMVSVKLFRVTAKGRFHYDVEFSDDNRKMRLRLVDIGAERTFERVK